jgi:predicted DNA-binding transcriptional regulator YafY
MREEKYSRHWRILTFIRDHLNGKRVDEIARELECHERTVRRDIQMLQVAGFPIYSDKIARGTVWKIERGFTSVPMPPFSIVEALALVAARNTLRAQGEAFFSGHLDQVLDKMASRRNEEFRAHLQSLEKSVFCQARRRARKAPVPGFYDDIVRAIEEKKVLEVSYRNALGELSRNRRIAPIHLLIESQVMYLRAFCYRRKDVVTFALSRIEKVQLTDTQYTKEWEYDADAMAKSSFGVFAARAEEVELEFDDVLVGYFNLHPLHHSQRIRKVDGRARMALTVGINESLIHQLTGFGPRVWVLKPPQLSAILADRHRAALQRIGEIMGQQEQAGLPLEFE